MNTTLSTTLAPDPASAGAARRFITTALHRLDHEHFCDLAELLVSELVTNAILHARTTITLAVATTRQGVRVAVGDGSSRGPRQRSFSDQATTGRGLTLVESLATAWGSESAGSGKTVWFELTEDVMAL